MDPVTGTDPAAPAAPKAASAPPEGTTPPSPPAVPADAKGPATEPTAPQPPAEPAAPAAGEPGGLPPQARSTLTSLLADERFRPLEEPKVAGELSDDELTSFHDEYTKAAEDKAALGLLLNRAVSLSRRQLLAEQQAEEIRRGNGQRATQLLTAVHQQIEAVLKDQAPDVAPDLFWAWAAPAAARETPAHLTHPIDRWEWQLRRGVQLYRERFGTARTPTATPTTQDTTRRAATAVMPSGSVQPRSGPSGKPRSFTDQLDARRERILPGATPR